MSAGPEAPPVGPPEAPPTARRRRRLALPGLLHAPDFRRFWIAQTISLFGDQVTLLALPLTAVLALDASPGDMGLLTAAALAAHLVLSLPAGVWIERVQVRRRLMIAADIGRALLLATIPLAYAFDALSMTQLYVVAFLTGCLAVAFDLSVTTVFVAITPREGYLEGNSLIHGSRSFSYIAGPSLGGVLVQVFSAPFALVTDAVSYVVSALYLGRVRREEPPLEPSEQEGMRRQLAEGMRFLRHEPVLRASLIGIATINLFNFMFHALFVLFATRELGIGAGALGLALGAGAVGGLVGAVVATRVGRRLGIGPAVVAGCFLFTVPLVLIPIAGGSETIALALVVVSELVSGFGVMVLDINSNSLMLVLTPDRLRARSGACFRVVNYGIRPVGALLGGVAGSLIGVRPTLWVATVGAIVGALYLVPSPLARVRELPEQAQ